jgi:hypothetical protein
VNACLPLKSYVLIRDEYAYRGDYFSKSP